MLCLITVALIDKCMFASFTETSSSRGAEESGEKKCMKKLSPKNGGGAWSILSLFALLVH